MSQQRLLDIKNGYNFRELGGYQTEDGRFVKWNKVLRSGELSELSDSDLAFLEDYGINFDVDLRSDTERQKASDKLPKKTKFIANPVFNSGHDKTERQYAEQYMDDATRGKQNMINSYQSMVTSPSAQKAFKNLFKTLLANTDDGAVLFHCAQGKDRTGLSAAFFLFALGVDEETIKKDYLLSKEAMKPFIQVKIDQYSKYGMTEELRQNLHDLYTVDESYFDAAMATIKAKYGNINNFLHEFIGLTDDDVAKLKEIYLTD